MNGNRKKGAIVAGAIVAAAVFLAGFGHGYRDPCGGFFRCEPHANMGEPR